PGSRDHPGPGQQLHEQRDHQPQPDRGHVLGLVSAVGSGHAPAAHGAGRAADGGLLLRCPRERVAWRWRTPRRPSPPPGRGRPTGDVIAGLGVVHVPHDGQFTGSGDLIFSGTVTITTGPGTPTISSGIPSGVRFDVWPQECPCGSPSCPELAVIHTQQFVVNAAATGRVPGRRPLVVIASSNVLVDGLLDAGGHLTAPGPGGAAAGAGPGAGGAGQSNGTNDAGGGGAGFGQVGAAGGDATMPSSRARGGGGGAEYDA